MKKHTRKHQKKRYHLKNWSRYNRSLVQRGSLDIWLDQEAQSGWYAPPTHEVGAPTVYSAIAITTVLTIRMLFHLPLRATEGFVASIFRLTNVLLPAPNYSTLSRRGRSLKVKLPKRSKEKTVMVVDSTGVKVYGEGEWKVRQHGASKRRTWKKIHVAVDADGEIRAVEVTGNEADDASMVGSLLGQETASVTAFIADGSYDKAKVYRTCAQSQVAKIIIPPQANARIWHHGNSKASPHPRDENLRAIRQSSRQRWKVQSGYHLRSLVENTMFRWKTIVGDRLQSREWSRQVTELKLAGSILNRFLHLGMPQSYATT